MSDNNAAFGQGMVVLAQGGPRYILAGYSRGEMGRRSAETTRAAVLQCWQAARYSAVPSAPVIPMRPPLFVVGDDPAA